MIATTVATVQNLIEFDLQCGGAFLRLPFPQFKSATPDVLVQEGHYGSY